MNTDRDNDVVSSPRDERFCQSASRVSSLDYSHQNRTFTHTQQDRCFPLSSALNFHQYLLHPNLTIIKLSNFKLHIFTKSQRSTFIFNVHAHDQRSQTSRRVVEPTILAFRHCAPAPVHRPLTGIAPPFYSMTRRRSIDPPSHQHTFSPTSQARSTPSYARKP